MHPKNETCVQRAKFRFFLFPQSRKTLDVPLEEFLHGKNVTPEGLRQLGTLLARRSERIASMMEVLTQCHQDWAVTGNRDVVVMETQSWDFVQATQVLKEHGFHEGEYELDVEYTRKWGVL